MRACNITRTGRVGQFKRSRAHQNLNKIENARTAQRIKVLQAAVKLGRLGDDHSTAQVRTKYTFKQ